MLQNRPDGDIHAQIILRQADTNQTDYPHASINVCDVIIGSVRAMQINAICRVLGYDAYMF